MTQIHTCMTMMKLMNKGHVDILSGDLTLKTH